MIRLKNYFFIALLTFSAVPMDAMQQGLGYLRGKAYETFNPAILEHYKTLGLDASATDQEIKQAYHRLSRKHHPDRVGGDTVLSQKINAADEALEAHVRNRTFFDLYIAGCLIAGTTVAVAGLTKTWRLYKEYSSPNSILLEKMEAAATKAVSVILKLEFDRYNPTKDTDALCLQFEIEPLLVQLSSDKVRDTVKKAIIAFDKTLEATYEQCAWHYDGMTFEELAVQNPRLVKTMLTQLQLLLEALELCKTDLQLDRNKPLEFLKAHYKKMIGCGLAGAASWYAFKEFMTAQIIAPQAQPLYL